VSFLLFKLIKDAFKTSILNQDLCLMFLSFLNVCATNGYIFSFDSRCPVVTNLTLVLFFNLGEGRCKIVCLLKWFPRMYSRACLICETTVKLFSEVMNFSFKRKTLTKRKKKKR